MLFEAIESIESVCNSQYTLLVIHDMLLRCWVLQWRLLTRVKVHYHVFMMYSRHAEYLQFVIQRMLFTQNKGVINKPLLGYKLCYRASLTFFSSPLQQLQSTSQIGQTIESTPNRNLGQPNFTPQHHRVTNGDHPDRKLGRLNPTPQHAFPRAIMVSTLFSS